MHGLNWSNTPTLADFSMCNTSRTPITPLATSAATGTGQKTSSINSNQETPTGRVQNRFLISQRVRKKNCRADREHWRVGVVSKLAPPGEK
jgi:hypothetical protein